MKLLEQMPDPVSQKIQDVLTHEEEALIRVSTDLNPDGTFGEQWLIATDRRVIVVPTEGIDGVVDVPIRELAAVQTEPLVGGGRLEIDRKKEATLFVPYSSSLAEKFSEVALGLEQLRQQDEFLINTELDQTRCSKCGRLLPEKNGICTACIRRLATLGRIASYLIPYKGRAVLLALISLVTIGADLLPPLVMRQIVDNVFLLKEETVRSIDQRAALLGQWILVLIGLRILSWSMELAHGWIVSWLSARMTADIRSHLYRRLEMLTMQFYSDRRVGALMSRVTRDSDMLREFLVNGLP